MNSNKSILMLIAVGWTCFLVAVGFKLNEEKENLQYIVDHRSAVVTIHSYSGNDLVWKAVVTNGGGIIKFGESNTLMISVTYTNNK